MNLATTIKQLRLKAGLTQEGLAEKLGVSAQLVSKWENAVAMPDITLLPLLAEEFGVSIDDLFDLTVSQKLNRIDHRMDMEEELPHDVFVEYEEFLKTQLGVEEYKQRATSLLAHLYDHNMRAFAAKAARYAKESILMAPEVKDCQWILNMAAGHAVWDWNIGNHHDAVDFYKEVVASDKVEPRSPMPYYYLIDNLLADHRADEAERYLAVLATLPAANPVLLEVYPAFIALARYDVARADALIEEVATRHPEDANVLFEAAQYYVRKCEYDKAIRYYNLSYAHEKRHPRYCDAPMTISDIYAIMGDYAKAAEEYQRVIDNMRDEWHMDDEEVELKNALRRKAQLIEKANS